MILKPCVKVFFQNGDRTVNDGSSASRVDLRIFGNQAPESTLYEFRNAISQNLFSQSIDKTASIIDVGQSLQNIVLQGGFSDRMNGPISQEVLSGLDLRKVYNGRQVQTSCEKIQDTLQNQQFSEISRPLNQIIQQNIDLDTDLQFTLYRQKNKDSVASKDNHKLKQFSFNNDLEQVNQIYSQEDINYLQNQQNFGLIPQAINTSKDEMLKSSFEINFDSRNSQPKILIVSPSRGSYKGKSKIILNRSKNNSQISQKDNRSKKNSQMSLENSKQLNPKQEQNQDHLLKDLQTKISDKQDKFGDDNLDIQYAKYSKSSLMDSIPIKNSISPNQFHGRDLSTNNIQKMISKFEEYGRVIELEVPLISLDCDATRNIEQLGTDLIMSQKVTNEASFNFRSETESPIRETRMTHESNNFQPNYFHDQNKKSPKSPMNLLCTCYEWLFLNYEQFVKEETPIICKKYYYEVQRFMGLLDYYFDLIKSKDVLFRLNQLKKSYIIRDLKDQDYSLIFENLQTKDNQLKCQQDTENLKLLLQVNNYLVELCQFDQSNRVFDGYQQIITQNLKENIKKLSKSIMTSLMTKKSQKKSKSQQFKWIKSSALNFILKKIQKIFVNQIKPQVYILNPSQINLSQTQFYSPPKNSKISSPKIIKDSLKHTIIRIGINSNSEFSQEINSPSQKTNQKLTSKAPSQMKLIITDPVFIADTEPDKIHQHHSMLNTVNSGINTVNSAIRVETADSDRLKSGKIYLAKTYKRPMTSKIRQPQQLQTIAQKQFLNDESKKTIDKYIPRETYSNYGTTITSKQQYGSRKVIPKQAIQNMSQQVLSPLTTVTSEFTKKEQQLFGAIGMMMGGVQGDFGIKKNQHIFNRFLRPQKHDQYGKQQQDYFAKTDKGQFDSLSTTMKERVLSLQSKVDPGTLLKDMNKFNVNIQDQSGQDIVQVKIKKNDRLLRSKKDIFEEIYQIKERPDSHFTQKRSTILQHSEQLDSQFDQTQLKSETNRNSNITLRKAEFEFNKMQNLEEMPESNSSNLINQEECIQYALSSASSKALKNQDMTFFVKNLNKETQDNKSSLKSSKRQSVTFFQNYTTLQGGFQKQEVEIQEVIDEDEPFLLRNTVNFHSNNDLIQPIFINNFDSHCVSESKLVQIAKDINQLVNNRDQSKYQNQVSQGPLKVKKTKSNMSIRNNGDKSGHLTTAITQQNDENDKIQNERTDDFTGNSVVILSKLISQNVSPMKEKEKVEVIDSQKELKVLNNSANIQKRSKDFLKNIFNSPIPTNNYKMENKIIINKVNAPQCTSKIYKSNIGDTATFRQALKDRDYLIQSPFVNKLNESHKLLETYKSDINSIWPAFQNSLLIPRVNNIFAQNQKPETKPAQDIKKILAKKNQNKLIKAGDADFMHQNIFNKYGKTWAQREGVRSNTDILLNDYKERIKGLYKEAKIILKGETNNEMIFQNGQATDDQIENYIRQQLLRMDLDGISGLHIPLNFPNDNTGQTSCNNSMMPIGLNQNSEDSLKLDIQEKRSSTNQNEQRFNIQKRRMISATRPISSKCYVSKSKNQQTSMHSLAFSQVTGQASQIHTRTVSLAKGKVPADFTVEIKYKFSPSKFVVDETNSIEQKSNGDQVQTHNRGSLVLSLNETPKNRVEQYQGSQPRDQTTDRVIST